MLNCDENSPKREQCSPLLVECNGLVRLKLRRALGQEHFQVLWTATIQEAVMAHNWRHIDLLLLDLNQPLKVHCQMFGPLEAFEPDRALRRPSCARPEVKWSFLIVD